MADVFISYSSEERGQAERLAAALQKLGYSVWWDRNLEGGADFSDDIEREMHAAGAIVVAWSERAAKSHWVRDEASYGRDAGKLVPITLDGSQPPIGFRQVQTIDFSGWSGADDDRVARLASAVDRCCGKQSVEPIATSQATAPKVSMVVAAVGALLMLLAAGWWFTSDRGESAAAQVNLAQTGIAVLPFRSLSGDDEDRFFAEGVTEEIRNRLGALDELRVIGRLSSLDAARQELPLNEVAAQLDVSHVVEGTVRRAGTQYRITAQLIDPASDTQLWSGTYDAIGSEDLFAAQEDIAQRIAETLDVLLDGDKRKMMANAGIDNPEAFALMARGDELFMRAHDEDNYGLLADANMWFDAAFEAEPTLWIAKVLSADRYAHDLFDHGGGFVDLPPARLAGSQEAYLARLDQAIAAAPPAMRPSIQHQRMPFTDDWSDGGALVRRVYAGKSPCTTAGWPEFLGVRMGLLDEMRDYLKRMSGCDPTGSRGALAQLHILRGEPDEAIALLDRLIEQGQASQRASLLKLLALLSKDDLPAAEAVIRQMDTGTFHYDIAQLSLQAYRGDEEALRKGVADGPQQGLLPMIHAAALLGDRALANRYAAMVDARAGGPAMLEFGNGYCMCGDMFDLSATPRLAARLREAGVSGSLPNVIDYPLKDW